MDGGGVRPAPVLLGDDVSATDHDEGVSVGLSGVEIADKLDRLEEGGAVHALGCWG